MLIEALTVINNNSLSRGNIMSIEKTLFAFAGIMVMLTTFLAMYHNPLWAWGTLFVGFNLFQSQFTGFCIPGIIMKKMGMKTEADLAAS